MQCRDHESLFASDLKDLSRFLNGQLRRRGKNKISILGVQIRLLWKGLLSLLYQRKAPLTSIECDVLLVHPSSKSFALGRKQPFIAALRERGLHVEEFIEDDEALIKGRLFCAPPRIVPLIYRWDAAHAAYLLNRYQAKVIITERNSWIVPSFIKRFRQGETRVVHLAHSVLTSQSEGYSYFDYDYYLVFGRSSYAYLSGLEESFGECVVCYAGPYFFCDSNQVADRHQNNTDALGVLFLAPGPSYEKKSSYLEQCSWVVEWLRQNKNAKLKVKVHPRGTGLPWKDFVTDDSQIEILPPSVQLDQVAVQSDLVLTGYTNAVIDVSRVGVPFILLGEDSDYFSSELFGMPRARSGEQLNLAIKAVQRDRAAYRERSLNFFTYHVDNNLLPLASLVHAVSVLVSGGKLEGKFVAHKKAYSR